MALKATVYKAHLQLSDMDRNVYGEHSLTLARHPSETEERLMVRLLAFALHTPPGTQRGALEFAKGLSDTDEPDLWQRDLTGEVVHWIDLGQPDERRLTRACGRAEQVTVISYSASTPIWWSGIHNALTRLDRLRVWQLPAEQSQALGEMAQRGMQVQVTVQDGTIWFSAQEHTVELQLVALK